MTIRTKRIVGNCCLAVVMLAMTIALATALSGLAEPTLWLLGVTVFFGIPSWITAEE